MTSIENYISDVSCLLSKAPTDSIQRVADLVLDAYMYGRGVYVMGNGGSAATASHLACDLQKSVGLCGDRKFKVMALTDSTPLLTAWANDFDYSDVFASQLATWIQPGDVVIGISGSGNSANVVKAIETAGKLGAVTVAITGFDGGRLSPKAMHSIIMPSEDMQHIEDSHMVVAHLIFRYVLDAIAEKDGAAKAIPASVMVINEATCASAPIVKD
jgi:D-sedoheptulose 7-phosphate isomerase